MRPSEPIHDEAFRRSTLSANPIWLNWDATRPRTVAECPELAKLGSGTGLAVTDRLSHRNAAAPADAKRYKISGAIRDQADLLCCVLTLASFAACQNRFNIPRILGSPFAKRSQRLSQGSAESRERIFDLRGYLSEIDTIDYPVRLRLGLPKTSESLPLIPQFQT